MNKKTQLSSTRPFQRLYALFLKAYPASFRREYGPQMTQLFRDCYRAAESRERLGVLTQFWFLTLLDLVKTAPKEHLDTLRKERAVMNNLRRDAIALLGCTAIIVVAFMLLRYILEHPGSATLLGYALDAMVVTGVVGNFIVFLLVKTTKLNPLRAALWTFLMVHALPVIALTIIGSQIDSQIRLGVITIGYVVSFLFWYGVHWMWTLTKSNQRLAAEDRQ